MDRPLVIIPTYNEIENVENIILAVMNLPAPQFDVLIVDDNSPDGTAEVVRTLQRICSRVARKTDWDAPTSPVSNGLWSGTIRT